MPRFCLIPLLSVPIATAAAAAGQPYVSWGKAAVPYATYRSDAAECGIRGAQQDMTGQDSFKTTMHGLHAQDSVLDNPAATDSLREYVYIYRRDIRGNVKNLQGYLQDGVQSCLADRGYRRFALTGRQKKTLASFRIGSEARFQYLHSLGSDAHVLDSQALPDGAEGSNGRDR